MIADRARLAGGWAAALLGRSIPTSIVASNIRLAVIVVARRLSEHHGTPIARAMLKSFASAGFAAGIPMTRRNA